MPLVSLYLHASWLAPLVNTHQLLFAGSCSTDLLDRQRELLVPVDPVRVLYSLVVLLGPPATRHTTAGSA